MPLVTISMYPGRSPEQKRALVSAITDAVVEHAKAHRDGVEIVIHEIPREHWAFGGTLAGPPPANRTE